MYLSLSLSRVQTENFEKKFHSKFFRTRTRRTRGDDDPRMRIKVARRAAEHGFPFP